MPPKAQVSMCKTNDAAVYLPLGDNSAEATIRQQTSADIEMHQALPEEAEKHQAEAEAASELQATTATLPPKAPQVQVSMRKFIDAADNLPLGDHPAEEMAASELQATAVPLQPRTLQAILDNTSPRECVKVAIISLQYGEAMINKEQAECGQCGSLHLQQDGNLCGHNCSQVVQTENMKEHTCALFTPSNPTTRVAQLRDGPPA